jgi:hypothetical protein
MTTSTDSQRRPVFVDRRNNRFFADPLIGNGAWPQVPLAVFYGSYAADPASNPYGSQIAVGDLYFNTSANILRVWDGSLWQDAGGSNSSLFRWKKIAAGGETSLSGLDDGSTTLAYTPGSEFLYLNGALLARGADYVATTGTSITGLAALTASDVVEVFSFNALNLANLNAGAVAFTQSGAGAVQRTVEGKLRDVISVKDFGAVGDGVTDDTTAIQAAIDSQYLKGGGTVWFPTGTYLVSNTITVPQRVVLAGESHGFANQYIPDYPSPKGSTLFLATNSNVSVVEFSCRLIENGGNLEETVLGGLNADARHFGGMRNMTVWGNRSKNPLPTSVDLNNAGYGIIIKGSRYINLENIVAMFCAQSGIRSQSNSYGSQTISCNNMTFSKVASLSNAGDGFSLFGGDSTLTDLSAGYNALSGLQYGMSGTVNGGIFWNNFNHGVFVNGTTNTSSCVFNGLHSYDNDEVGFRIGNGRAPICNGCVARGNGRDTGAALEERSNFLVSSGAEGWSLTGCRSYARDQTSTLVTYYGFRINNTTYSGSIEGSTEEGSTIPYSISDSSKIITHGSVTSQIPHPPLSLQGNLSMNGNRIVQVGLTTFNSWQTISTVSGGILSVPTNTLIALQFGAPTTITEFSYTGSDLPMLVIRNITSNVVTFTYDSTKLRLANSTDLLLGENEVATFVRVTGSIWQQTGGAY